MNIFKMAKRKGVSLRNLNVVMVVIAIFISAVLFVAMHITSDMYARAHTITQNLLSWEVNSYNLQIASDYLTEQMRSFVITGKKQYLDHYFEEARVTKRREKALEDLKSFHGETTSYRDLSAAMQESVNLMNTEYHAARLAVEAYGYDVSYYPEEIRRYELSPEELSMHPSRQKEAAELMLFDENYSIEKEQISEHISRCLSDLAVELNAEQRDIAQKLNRQVFIEHALTVLLIVIMLCIVLMTSRLVVKPLMKCVDMIRDEMDIPVKGAYEIRFLAKTYNQMYEANKETKKKLVYEAIHDPLTGLYNRAGYDELCRELNIATSAILLIDLDDFKSANDTYGHDFGDDVLRKVSDSIRRSFRAIDFACRIGGDEFAVIMMGMGHEHLDLIEQKIEKINAELAEFTKDRDVNAAVSCGIAFGEEGMNYDELFKRADVALYYVKEHGKKGCAAYSEDMAGTSGERE